MCSVWFLFCFSQQLHFESTKTIRTKLGAIRLCFVHRNNNKKLKSLSILGYFLNVTNDEKWNAVDSIICKNSQKKNQQELSEYSADRLKTRTINLMWTVPLFRYNQNTKEMFVKAKHKLMLRYALHFNTTRTDSEPPKNPAPKGTVRRCFATECNPTKQYQLTPICLARAVVCAPDKTRTAIDY